MTLSAGYPAFSAHYFVKSIIPIAVVCTGLELGPFKHIMEETGFSERICYFKFLNRGEEGGGDQFSCRNLILIFDAFILKTSIKWRNV